MRVSRLLQRAEEFVETNREALDNLTNGLYTKLLIARFHLLTAGTDDTAESLIARLFRRTRSARYQETPALRQSKGATLISKRRLANIERREQSLRKSKATSPAWNSGGLDPDNAAMRQTADHLNRFATYE
jgi:hypothetical protein